jgi:hypothetical protein
VCVYLFVCRDVGTSNRRKKIGRSRKHWQIKLERTCTDPCLSAGVRLPSVPFGTSAHAATPPLFVYFRDFRSIFNDVFRLQQAFAFRWRVGGGVR